MKKPTPGNQTEWFIKKQVRQILIDTGWEFWMPSANAYGRSGTSDFLAVKSPCLFMAIETKYKNVPTAPQLAFLKIIDEAGHYAFLVDETNIERLQTVLSRPYIRLNNQFEPLMKWKVTEHDHPPTNQERRLKAARPVSRISSAPKA